jgi:uncharacterized protein (TIGR00255 family)
VRDEGGGLPQAVRADVELARGYAKALEEVRVALSLPEPVSLALVAAQPGVISVGEGLPDSDALWIALKPGLEQAVAALVEARAREGAALTEDLLVRLSSMEKFAADLRELTRDSPDLYRKRLQERLERALGISTGDERLPAIVDPQRLAQEVAILADKVDITEELTRLQAHLAEFRRLLSDGGAVGRRLDFLTQDVNREINTIGSKSQHAGIAATVVELKAELERIREQVQNVE